MGWQAVGLGRDLGPGQVMAAVVAGVELAVWRSAAGVLAAFADRCPHRGMRLSHGFVRGETLACLYHGWVYAAGGGCLRIPAHPDLVPPAAIRARVMQVTEADGVIWVAEGAVPDAPPALPGWRPLRSMPFDCTADRLAEVTGFAVQEDRLIGPDLCLLLQRRPTGMMVHALTQGDALTASRWLEAARWEAEA